MRSPDTLSPFILITTISSGSMGVIVYAAGREQYMFTHTHAYVSPCADKVFHILHQPAGLYNGRPFVFIFHRINTTFINSKMQPAFSTFRLSIHMSVYTVHKTAHIFHAFFISGINTLSVSTVFETASL